MLSLRGRRLRYTTIKKNRNMNIELKEKKKQKLHCILDHILDQESQGKLISMWKIYEDHGCPKYKTPKRFFSYPRQKEYIQYLIEQNDMQVDKVIKYEGKDILVNFDLAIHYLRELDAYYWYAILDLTMSKESNDFQKIFLEKWRNYD
jgi:hypothetical protein